MLSIFLGSANLKKNYILALETENIGQSTFWILSQILWESKLVK